MSGSQKKTYLIELWLVSNPKAMRRKPLVLRVRGSETEFVRATIPYFEGKHRIFVGGKYTMREGEVYVIRSDCSSHRHECIVYELCIVRNGELETIAKVTVEDGNLRFSPAELEEIYAFTQPNSGNRIVQTLIEYAKRRGLA